MTDKRDLKRRIRERQHKTGESYTAARAHVMRERDALLGTISTAMSTERAELDAVVLKVNLHSARVRVLGEDRELTFRSSGVWKIVPGHLVTLAIEKRWSWHGDPYASGKITSPRIDIDKLGLVPLPLKGGELEDLREAYEPYDDPKDLYTALWRKNTERPRAAFEFDEIAWGAFPGDDPEDNPTCEAAELREAGDDEGARELLMEALHRDLRCIDAHSHLGNLAFDRSPKRAIVHYETGVRIGELSLPPDFDGVLLWSYLYNRPFLRCLHGYGLCLWRLGKFKEAQDVFERILSLNPNDNQGVRGCWADVMRGRSWDELYGREDEARRGLN